jgi:hypothetical protein
MHNNRQSSKNTASPNALFPNHLLTERFGKLSVMYCEILLEQINNCDW